MPHRRRSSASLVLLVPMAAAVLFAGWQLLIEYRAAAALDNLAKPLPVLVESDTATSPREAIYHASALVRAAAALSSGQRRDRYLARARTLVDQAVTERPQWGEAMVVQTHLNAVSSGLDSGATLASYTRSYQLAPFLRDSADWRIRFAVANWDRLSEADRAAAVNEAILLSRVSRQLRLHVRILTVGTPLYPLVANRVWPDSAGAR